MTLSITIPSWKTEPHGAAFWSSLCAAVVGVTVWMVTYWASSYEVDSRVLGMGFAMGGMMTFWFGVHTVFYLMASQPWFQRWERKEIEEMKKRGIDTMGED